MVLCREDLGIWAEGVRHTLLFLFPCGPHSLANTIIMVDGEIFIIISYYLYWGVNLGDMYVKLTIAIFFTYLTQIF